MVIQSRMKRIIGAAFTVMIGALIGASPVAQASEYNIDPDSPVTLTIHKFEQPNATLGPETDGTVQDTTGLTPIPNAKFEVREVTQLPSGETSSAVDLLTSAGWDLINPFIENSALFSPTDENVVLGEATEIITNADGEAVFTGEVGLYWVQETETGTNKATDLVDPFLVTLPQAGPTEGTWIYDVHAYPKSPVIESIMSVNHDESLGLGSPVNWTVETEIPYLGRNTLSTFKMENTIPAEMSYVDSAISVLDAEGVAVSDLVVDADYTITTVGTSSSAVFTEAGLTKLSAVQGGTVTFSLNTIVNSIGSGMLTSSTVTTVNDSIINVEGITTWGAVEISTFVEGDNTKPLGNATFSVYASQADADAMVNPISVNGVTEFVTDTTTGKVMIEGLYAAVGGTNYWVVETDAPAGYMNDVTPHQITVTPGSLDEATELGVGQVQAPGATLPPLGSTGLIAFIIIGILSLVSGLAMVYSNRRKAYVKIS